VLLIALPKGLCMHNNLVGCIYHGKTVISLDHSTGALHLCTFIVCDIALSYTAAPAGLVIVVVHPLPDLTGLLPEPLYILPLFGYQPFVLFL